MHLKKHYFALVLLTLLLTLGLSPLHAQDVTGDFPPVVGNTIQRAIDRSTEGTVPGVVVLIDTPQGRFVGAGGFADVENEIPLEPNDSFRIGSITKIFTAVLVLQLHEEGVLNIHDSISTWLPDVAERLPYGEDIILYHLLSHTSGVFSYNFDVNFRSLVMGNPTREWAPVDLVNWVIEHNEPDFAPGTDGEWNYSNTGYVLLGMVIEAATGHPIAELYRERIFEPMGMASTYLADSEPATSELVQGYNVDGENMTELNMTFAWTAGALVANVTDVAIFMRALFAAELFQNAGTLDLMMITVTYDGSPIYALGLIPITDGVWGHNGGTPGFASQVFYSQITDTVVVMLSNNEAFTGARTMAEINPFLLGDA